MNSKIKSIGIDVAIILAGALAIFASYRYYAMGGIKIGMLFGLLASFAISIHFGTKYGKKKLEPEA